MSGINEVMVANRVCGPIHLVGEEISIIASLEPIHVDGNLQSTFFILWICSRIRPHGQLSKTVGELSELVARYRLAPELLMVPAIPEGVKANSALPL